MFKGGFGIPSFEGWASVGSVHIYIYIYIYIYISVNV